MQQEIESVGNDKHLFQIKCSNSSDEFTILGRPCELSAFSFVPQNRLYESAERSIYNSKTNKTQVKSDYDRLFTVDPDFNNKVHRCDRKHAKLRDLDAWSEEIKKVIPNRHSTDYGKRMIKVEKEEKPVKVNYESNLDPPNRKYTRIAKVQSDFYNRNGINDLNRQRNVL
jgi:hypothetical protein